MVSSAKIQFCTQGFMESLPEPGGESYVPIWYDLFRNSVQSKYFFKEYLSDSRCIEGGLYRDEVGTLGELVYHYHDVIVPLRGDG